MNTIFRPKRFGSTGSTGSTTLASIILLLIGLPTIANGQATTQAPTQSEQAQETDAEETDKNEQRQIERDLWTTYYAQQIPKYTLYLESDKKTPLKVISEPKLRYWNAVRMGNNHGELFIWTRDGRCVVAGALLSYEVWTNVREVAHEFHSFSPEKILGQRNADPFEIGAPGVEFKLVPNAKPPAKSRALRMVQLRKMAKQFEASTLSKAISTLSGKREDIPLRPLSQPIFRYETKDIDEDGAIFAYVTGTDPEVLVAIESQQTKDGPQWFYGAARFTDLPITLKHQKKTVWEFDEAATYAGGYEFKRYERQPFIPNLEKEETKEGDTKTEAMTPKSKVKDN